MIRTARVAGYEVAYSNEVAFWQTYQEIFEENEYDIVCHDPHPLILDCGSHIGLSVLYFKKQCPDARIVAFEPDPHNYELLQRNIVMNELQGVMAINVAIANYTGYATYYREVPHAEDVPDTRGYSISHSWGNRGHSQELQVKTLQLSNYIQEPVSYLKLDVEGVEQSVLLDIEEKLDYVQQICIEYHGTHLNPDDNNLNTIVDLLQRNHFDVEITSKELQAFLPSAFDEWVRQANPTLSKICAVRN